MAIPARSQSETRYSREALRAPTRGLTCIAWGLIVLALVSEAVATLVYWLRSRPGPG